MQKSQQLEAMRVRLVFRHCILTALLIFTLPNLAHATDAPSPTHQTDTTSSIYAESPESSTEATDSNDFIEWTRNEIQLLHGWDYELGESEYSLITYEHVSGWKYGYNNFFFDFLDPGLGRDAAETYFEAYTWFSYEKVTGQEIKWGILDDVAFAIGFNASDLGFRAYRAGPTLIFDMPGLDVFSIDFFVLDDWSNPQVTYAITPFLDKNFKLGRFQFKLRGFYTFVGKEGEAARQINAQQQLLLDLGHFWGYDDKLYVGVEYQYNKNKYGVEGVDETVPQAMIMWHFE